MAGLAQQGGVLDLGVEVVFDGGAAGGAGQVWVAGVDGGGGLAAEGLAVGVPVGARLAVGVGVEAVAAVAPGVAAAGVLLGQAAADDPGGRVGHQGLAALVVQAPGEAGRQCGRCLVGADDLSEFIEGGAGPAYDGGAGAGPLDLRPQPADWAENTPHVQGRQRGVSPCARPGSVGGRRVVGSGQVAAVRLGAVGDRCLLRLFPAQRAALGHRRHRYGSAALAADGLVLAHARTLRPTALRPTAFAGTTTRDLYLSNRSNHRCVVSVERCTSGTLRKLRRDSPLDLRLPRRHTGPARLTRSKISDCSSRTHRKAARRRLGDLLVDGPAVGVSDRQHHDPGPATHPRRRGLPRLPHGARRHQPRQHLARSRRRAAQHPRQRRRPAASLDLHRTTAQLQPARRPGAQHHQQQRETVSRGPPAGSAGQ
ncbi:hypothetical protein C0Q61_30790 [Streptomyces albidoflavus]|nr:hypothetical protein C0Q61_30790 [Streptomyces albidoflavus]